MDISLDAVIKRTQSLLDDPSGSFFDKAYLLNFINQRYDGIIRRLTQLDLSLEEAVVVITPFAAGSTDLSAYLATGGLLESLLTPERLEWKLVGADDTEYLEAERKNPLPDVKAGTIEGISAWEWRLGNIFVTPSSVDVTLRSRHYVMTTNLVDPTDQTIRGIADILSYKTAELVAITRGNDKLIANMVRLGTEAMEDFEVLLVKDEQVQTRRLGRFSSRGMNKRPRYIAR